MHPWRTPTTSAATARRLQAPHLQPARRLHFRVPVHGQARAQSRVPLLAAYRGHGLPPPSASASRAHPGKNTGCGLPRAPCPSTSTTARLVNLFSPTALHYRRHLALGAPCSAAAPLWSRCAPPSLRPSAATAGRAGWPASAGSFPCCSFPPRPPAPDLALPSLPALPTCGRAASARRSRGEGDQDVAGGHDTEVSCGGVFNLVLSRHPGPRCALLCCRATAVALLRRHCTRPPQQPAALAGLLRPGSFASCSSPLALQLPILLHVLLFQLFPRAVALRLHAAAAARVTRFATST